MHAYSITLYFQLQFIKVNCTINGKSAIKCSLKKKRLSAKQQRDLNLQNRKCHENPEKKKQAEKRRYDDKEESVKQYTKEKHVEN